MQKSYFLMLLANLVAFDVFTQQLKDSVSIINNQYVDEVEVLAPIVIHSQKKWTGSFSYLSSNKLSQNNSYGIADQLNAVPGVFMQHGTLNTNRITIRGVGSRTPYNTNRIKAYYGDIPLTDGDGVTSIEDIGFNEIGSVNIVKGPSSSLYGAGIGGAIVIEPFNFKNISDKIIYKSEVADYNTFSNQINLNIKTEKGSCFGVAGGVLNSDGYRNNNNYNRNNFSLQISRKLGAHTLFLLFRYRYLDAQIPSSINRTDFIENPKKAAFSWNRIKGFENNTKLLGGINLKSPINLKMYHSFSLFGNTSDLDELRPFNRLKETKKSIGFRDKMVYSNEKHRLELGTEMFFENTDVGYFSVDETNPGEEISNNRLKKGYANLYGLFESQTLFGVVYQLSINANRTFYRSLGDRNSPDSQKLSYNWIFSPRVGVSYELNSHSVFYVSLGHGFSTPSLEEAQFSNGLFNKDIKSEEGWGYDIGYRYSVGNNKVFGEIVWYGMNLSNLLVTKRESEDEFYGINAGSTLHYGIELSGNYNLIEPTKTNWLLLSSSFSNSKNEFKNFVDDGNVYDKNDLPGIPEFQLNMSLEFQFKKLNLLVSYRNIGKQYLNDGNSEMYKGYDLINLKTTLKQKVNRMNIDLYFGINNLLNKGYASMVLINAKSFGGNLPRYYYPALPLTKLA